MGKTELTSERRQLPFMFAVAVAVHQHHGHGADAVGLGAKKFGAHRVNVHRALDRAVGAHPLVNFGDALVKHVGLDDVPREDFRPRLIADAQRVAKTLGDEKQRTLALAFKQRIGGDRRAHLHSANARGRYRLVRREPEQMADARDRRHPRRLRDFPKGACG